MTMGRSKSNASDPFAAALRLLTRCDRSEAELRRKLCQFGFSRSAIDEAIERCHDYNYLDDERYACERARSMMRSGRGVGHRIRLDLRRRGLTDQTIDNALNTVENEFSRLDILHSQFEQRFPTFDYATADDRQRRRVISYFQRRGFSLDQIFSTIKRLSER